MSSPTDNLTTPEPDDPVPDMVELATNANAVSPAYWLNSIVKTITGFDALTIITDYVAGDWAAMQKAGTAIENLAKYNADYAVSIDSAVEEFEASWRGNAADNSRAYFTKLTDGLNKQVDPLQQIADEIKAFALSSYGLAQTVSGLVQTLFDLAAMYAIKQAAVAALSATVAGAPAAAAMQAAAALDAARMIKTWIDIWGKLGLMFAGSEGTIGLISAGINGAVDSAELPAINASGYDHPGVYV
ncbi:WXG100 family type VII secretion target [Nocardia cyriacigeorgica]|uniref:WXG100 family type VII secretion target n=1 Tax=Nocardia cyriacigeorgica TaxID=135487 RepID=UPI001895DCBF|nr:WXG100 family type VII secretion target [Nocardia cyriacigeorgica]MBF6455245.1 WXG100 family type VII secretion target [Nocardia cyriacigeorgica]MBF6554013.1 WXG100 family type VII secretion target [Nocardia cyriacigeorgica]